MTPAQAERDMALRKNSSAGRTSHGWAHVEMTPEVPPAVLAARLALGWSLADAKKVAKVTNLPQMGMPARAEPTEEVKPTPCLEDCRMVNQAGEVLVRKRGRGPWEPVTSCKKSARGNAEVALSIALSENQRYLAQKQFESLKFAPATSNVKDSLFSLWERICKGLGCEPLPLSVSLMDQVAAILRASGYRAVLSYVQEAKSRHVKAGYDWSDRLQQGMADIKRAAKRAIGPATRAEELKLDWWTKIIVNHGKEPKEATAQKGEPMGGVRAWLLAIQFLLRETELASLTLDEECIRLDHQQKTVSLHLTVQKTDPAARGTWRALACICGKEYPYVCPFHTATELVSIQLKRLNMKSQSEAENKNVPLIGRSEDPMLFVEKEKMISHAQRFAELMKDKIEEAKEISVERVTGHFARRTGVKHLARKGVSYTAIQWMARHSSQVTMQYIENAWEEMPRAEMKLQDTMTMNELAANVLGRVGQVEEAIQQVEEQMTEQVRCVCPTEWIPQNREDFRKEIRSAMIPKWVFSLQSKKLHKACRASCIGANPRFWSTECGWKWFDSVNHCNLIYEDEERESSLYGSNCMKCFAVGWEM